MRRNVRTLLVLLLSLVLLLQGVPFHAVAQEVDVLPPPEDNAVQVVEEEPNKNPDEEVIDVQEEAVEEDSSEEGSSEENATEELQPQSDAPQDAEDGDSPSFETQDDDSVVLSNTFTLTSAKYNGYKRSTKVYYKDSQGGDLQATVSGNIDYGLGEQVDFEGTYGELLDPEIASLYDLSRVYVQLTNEQKNFRYLELNTARSVGDNSNDYKIYLYKTGLDQCRVGGEYRGTWYTLNTNNDTNIVYIVFDRVANPSFKAIEKVDGVGQVAHPVVGAEFTLYTDENCYTAFSYKGREVKAVSDENGTVSFGKIPFGTYYMKETVVPAGYKDEGIIRELKIDEEHALELDDVEHVDADGSTILSSIKQTTLKVVWPEGEDLSEHTVTIQLNSQGEKVDAWTIGQADNWTKTITDLDHRLSYVVSETKFDNQDLTDTDWVPTITKHDDSKETDFYQVIKFRQGLRYALITDSGQALSGSASGLGLTTGVQVGSDVSGKYVDGQGVTNDMIWEAVNVADDGVITLRNVATGKYLNYVDSSWTLDTNQSIKVRRTLTATEENPNINIYFRENMNGAAATYLSISDGNIVASSTAPSGGLFSVYQETEVFTETVTITNRHPTYDVRIRNMAYPAKNTPVAGMTYTLTSQNATITKQLVAGEDGYLVEQGASDAIGLQLPANVYTLTQTGWKDGYQRWMQPVTFTVLRVGLLRVTPKEQEIPNYAYVQTAPAGETWNYLKLHVPNQELATYTVDVAGDNDSPGPFMFVATVNGINQESFALISGESQQLVLPVGATFEVRQITGGHVTKVAAGTANVVRGRSYSESAGVVSGGNAIHFYNYRPICKIDRDGTEEPFESLNEAIGYARSQMDGTALVQMLVDYAIPANDAVSLQEGDCITLTTAVQTVGSEYWYEGEGVATVSRGLASSALFSVVADSTLALRDIAVLGVAEAAEPSVLLAASSKLELSGLVQIDGNPSDVGNLVLAADATGSELEIAGDLDAGSHVLVWGESSEMDGVSLYADEPFGITTASSASTVTGLEYLVSQKDSNVTASAGDGNQVIWMAHPSVEITLVIEGDHANLNKKFAFEYGSQNFDLGNGETITLYEMRSSQTYTFTQTDTDVTPTPEYGTASYNPHLSVTTTEGSSASVRASLKSSDARVLTLSNLRASPDDPAKVTITNVFSIDGALPTGIEDNVGVWTGIAIACGVLIFLLLLRRRAC